MILFMEEKVVVGLCFASYWNTLQPIHGKAVGSIFNVYPKWNIISYVMSNLRETVLRFRAVVLCDVWESLIAHATQMTLNITHLCEQYDSKISFHLFRILYEDRLWKIHYYVNPYCL